MNASSKYIQLMVEKADQVHAEGWPQQARNMYRDLLAASPDEPLLHYRLGMIGLELDDNPDARRHFAELVRLQPEFLEGRMLLGMVYAELGLHEESISCLREVLAVCPDVAEIHHRIGLSCTELNRYQEALDAFQEVLRLNPEHTGVLCSLGVLFTKTGQIGQARSFLQRAIKRQPDALNVINGLATVYKIGHIGENMHLYQRGLEIDPKSRILTSNYLYNLNYVPGLPPEFIAGKYREHAPRAYTGDSKWNKSGHRPLSGNARIRVGYLSADFYAHSVAFFLEPILQNHDRTAFEVFCYSNRTAGDETTERFKILSDCWRTIVGFSDESVAEMIAADRIDVLVDLSGHTSGHRLGVCVLKPAPVQVSWIGHPNTTGLAAMDYYLTDAWCDPPGMTDHLFSEKLYRLPRIFCSYHPFALSPEVAPVPSLKSGAITFGCFNNLKKINVELIAWWSRILQAVPGSQMLIKGPNLDDQEIRQELLGCFAEAGIAQNRIMLRGVTETRREHMALYGQVDIALDTFPYHGTTTTCEALWMGVPVVTLAGVSHVSRVGVSLLHSVGIDSLIAENPDDYIHNAVQLAMDRPRLIALRKCLRGLVACSSLMDAAGVTQEVEQAFRHMIEKRG